MSTEHTLSIRLATEADREEVTALCSAISEHDWIPEINEYLITPRETEGFYVAVQDGAVLGCYCLEFHGPDQAYLSGMRVHPNRQGKGVGTRLCQMQVEQARAKGAKDIYLLSKLDNYPAHRTVEKVGYANRGGWLVHNQAVSERLENLPAVERARPATGADWALVERFREEHRTGCPDRVIPSPLTWWVVKTEQPGDWDPARVVVVPGESGLDGVMLLSDTEDGLMVRWLDGTPEAVSDLFAFALHRMAEGGQQRVGFSLPLVKEPVLAPLGLDLTTGFRCYVFHLAS